ncbi:MAG TPA: hypothetical protein VFE16_07650 [Candidatus Cybelea sp.]|jgi:hypothetical protein|nr:hypothetical protein [Candidatus Cybelea sp.]
MIWLIGALIFVPILAFYFVCKRYALFSGKVQLIAAIVWITTFIPNVIDAVNGRSPFHHGFGLANLVCAAIGTILGYLWLLLFGPILEQTR